MVILAPGTRARWIWGFLFFFLTFFFVASSVVACQSPSLILILFSRQWYRKYIRYTQQIFASWIVIVSWACAGPIEFLLSGDYRDIAKEEHVVIMANHQTYTDWWWIWLLARQSHNHGDIFIILMNILKYIPIAGQGMWFFNFIFMKQKWSLDKATLTRRMHQLSHDNLPYWLIIFPEGTLNTPPGKKISHSYAKKLDIVSEPVHVLLPRSTGLQYCCENLQPGLRSLFDITIGYSGLAANDIPYYKHLPSTVYFAGAGPRQIHLHIKRFDIERLPGMNFIVGRKISEKEHIERKVLFSNWLRERFFIKDQKMVEFFEKKQFGYEKDTGKHDDVNHIKIAPTMKDWMMVTVTCCFVWGFVFAMIYYDCYQFI